MRILPLAALGFLLFARVFGAAADLPPGKTEERTFTETDILQLNQEVERLFNERGPRIALVKAQSALDVAQSVFRDKDHPYLATSLNNVAACLTSLGHPADALPSYTRALEMYKRLFKGQDHPYIARGLSNLAACLDELGRSDEALPLYEEALDMNKRLFKGEDHPFIATTLDRIAGSLRHLGRLTKALSYYQQALEMRKRIFDEGDARELALSLNNFASCLDDMGRSTEALPLFQKALEMRKRLFKDRDHPDVALSLNNLGNCLINLGQLAEALPIFQQALQMCKRVFRDKDDQDLAWSLNNVARCLKLLGRPNEALPLYQQSLAMIKRIFKDQDHPYVATSLNNLAACLDQLGRSDEALPLHRQALDMKRRFFKDRDHPDVALIIKNVAGCLNLLGRPTEALPLYRQALEMNERLFKDGNHPDVAASLHGVGRCMVALGRLDEAQSLFMDSLKIYKLLFKDRDHPDVVMSLNDLATCFFRQGNPTSSEPYARDSASMSIRLVEATSGAESESQQLSTLIRNRSCLDLWLSVCDLANRPEGEVCTQILQWKGSVTFRQHQMRQLRLLAAASADPKLSELFKQLDIKAQQLSALTLSTPDTPEKIEQRAKLIAQFTQEKNQLEADLSARSKEFARINSRKQPDLKQIQQSLAKADTGAVVLVDLLQYTHYSMPEKAGGKVDTERRLLAVVIRGDKQVATRIDLGAAQPIDQAVAEWRKAVLAGQDALKEGGKLRELVWDKLQPAMGEAKTVLICPDGSLCKVAFAALPGKTPGKYLLEEQAIATVASPSLLPEMLEQPAQNAKGAAGGLLAVGGVDYDADPGEASQLAVIAASERGRHGQSWPALSATGKEMELVSSRYTALTGKAGQVFSLTGIQATKAKVREVVDQCAYLHLATHGEFSSAEVPPAPTRGVERVITPQPEEKQLKLSMPLGALVLAGANKAKEFDPAHPQDNGYLTDMEVSQLNLQGVRLAVLSACETGLGADSAGEGLLGLQRAFGVAGARTVVASLWKIPDAQTQSVMSEFYTRLWDKDKPQSPLSALRQSQREILEHDLKPGEKKEPGPAAARRTPPLYWAAFVLSGDWR